MSLVRIRNLKCKIYWRASDWFEWASDLCFSVTIFLIVLLCLWSAERVLCVAAMLTFEACNSDEHFHCKMLEVSSMFGVFVFILRVWSVYGVFFCSLICWFIHYIGSHHWIYCYLLIIWLHIEFILKTFILTRLCLFYHYTSYTYETEARIKMKNKKLKLTYRTNQRDEKGTRAR